MSSSWNRNRLTAKLGIDYPIIQGPLGGLSSQQIDGGRVQLRRTRIVRSAWPGAESHQGRDRTDSLPYIKTVRNESVGVDGRRRRADIGREHSTGAWRRWPSISPPWERLVQHTNRIRRLDLTIRLACSWTRTCRRSASSTAFPAREILDECRAKKTRTIGTATTPDEAAALQDAGVTPSSLQASRPGRIAVRSSGPRRIR